MRQILLLHSSAITWQVIYGLSIGILIFELGPLYWSSQVHISTANIFLIVTYRTNITIAIIYKYFWDRLVYLHLKGQVIIMQCHVHFNCEYVVNDWWHHFVIMIIIRHYGLSIFIYIGSWPIRKVKSRAYAHRSCEYLVNGDSEGDITIVISILHRMISSPVSNGCPPGIFSSPHTAWPWICSRSIWINKKSINELQ